MVIKTVTEGQVVNLRSLIYRLQNTKLEDELFMLITTVERYMEDLRALDLNLASELEEIATYAGTVMHYHDLAHPISKALEEVVTERKNGNGSGIPH